MTVNETFMSINEASRIIETFLMIKKEKVLTINQTIDAIKRVPYYKDFMKIKQKKEND